MADSPPTNLRSLDARLRNHCEAVGRDLSRARRHIGALVVANLLHGTDTVVKGGRNLEIRYGLAATRASTDVDVVRAREFEEVLDHLEDALERGWAGFTGRLIDKGEIRAPVPPDYRPHRVEVKLDFEGRGFGTVQLEAAIEEAGGMQATDSIVSADGAGIFEAVGLPAPGTWLFDGVTNGERHYMRTYTGYSRLNAGNSLDSPPGSIEWTTGDFDVGVYQINGANSSIRHQGEIIQVGNAGSNGADGLTLGSRYDMNGSGGIHLDAFIAEFLVFDRALTELEIVQVEGYLASKWALDLRSRAILSGQATMVTKGEVIRISPKINIATRSRLQSEHDFGLKPSQISGLQLWVSASDLYLQWFNDEDRLTSWLSREGAPLAITQATLGFQPRYRRGVANNGRDAVRFQGAQFMRTALQAAQAQPNTTFIVSTVGGANQVLLDGAEPNGASRHALLSTATGRVSITAGGDTMASNGAAPTGVELWTGAFGYPQGSSIRRNAVPHATGDVGSHSWRGFTVGARFDGGSQYLNGDVVEILHFDRQLSDIELEFVENYLIAKHSLPRSGGGTLSGRASIAARVQASTWRARRRCSPRARSSLASPRKSMAKPRSLPVSAGKPRYSRRSSPAALRCRGTLASTCSRPSRLSAAQRSRPSSTISMGSSGSSVFLPVWRHQPPTCPGSSRCGPTSSPVLPTWTGHRAHSADAGGTEAARVHRARHRGLENDRATMIDLQLIALDLNDSELPEVRDICERLFRARTGHDWPPTINARRGWPVRYSEERAHVEADVHEDLDQAVTWANEFIGRVAQA